MCADAYELLDGHQAGQYHMVADGDVTGKGRIVRKDAVVPDNAVMGDVGVGHNEAVVSNDRLVLVRSTAVYGYGFPDGAIVADNDLRVLAPEFEILGNG